MKLETALRRMHKRNQNTINKYVYSGQIDNVIIPWERLQLDMHRRNQSKINSIWKKIRKQEAKEAALNNHICKSSKSTRYRQAKHRRTPVWVKNEQGRQMLKMAYRWANAMTQKTGIPHSVDHVIPLRGERVTGLHCIDNLCIMPTAGNCAKGNSFQL